MFSIFSALLKIIYYKNKLQIKKKDFKLVQEFIKRHFNDFDLFIKGEIDEEKKIEMIEQMKKELMIKNKKLKVWKKKK